MAAGSAGPGREGAALGRSAQAAPRPPAPPPGGGPAPPLPGLAAILAAAPLSRERDGPCRAGGGTWGAGDLGREGVGRRCPCSGGRNPCQAGAARARSRPRWLAGVGQGRHPRQWWYRESAPQIRDFPLYPPPFPLFSVYLNTKLLPCLNTTPRPCRCSGLWRRCGTARQGRSEPGSGGSAPSRSEMRRRARARTPGCPAASAGLRGGDVGSDARGRARSKARPGGAGERHRLTCVHL